ncbi:MAG: HlyC/CorC family transporter [Clostridia bacterium]|nr:HlyC/CorC family transporter [Clostridia bacterium]
MDTLPPQPMLFGMGVILILGFLTAFARAVSVGINDKRLEELAEENEKANRLWKYLDKNPSGLVDGLKLLGYVLAFLFSVCAILGFSDYIGNVLSGWGIENQMLVFFLMVASLALIITFIYMVFWEFVPERLAAKYAEKSAVALAEYSIFMSIIMRPLLWLISVISNIIAGIFGVRAGDLEEEITEEEIRMMVDIGSENGTIDDDEKEMIHNIFELDDKLVEDIMTHRKESCVLWLEDSIEKWREYIDETAHTRYPVCDEEIDNVIGIVNSRDFYRFLLNGGQKGQLRNIFREPYFVPDSMKADELFSRMQQKNTHMVVVMDEYGGFQGLVTQKDLLAEIVGELYSEDEEPELESEIVYLDENTWKIRGSAEIDEVEKALKIEIPEGDYNTFAGLVLEAIETLPEDGETVETEVGDLQIKVTSVVGHRIEEAIVCLKREVETPEEDEE